MKKFLFMFLLLLLANTVVGEEAQVDKDQHIDLLKIALSRSREQSNKCEEDFANLGSNFNKIMKQFRETTKELEELKKQAKPDKKAE